MYNKTITNLENIFSALDSARTIAHNMGELELYYSIDDTLEEVQKQMTVVRQNCLSKTLECVEEMDKVLAKVWDELDKPSVEIWNPEDFRNFFDKAYEKLNAVYLDGIMSGGDEDFLYNRLYQALLELDKASEGIEMAPPAENLFEDLEDDFPF